MERLKHKVLNLARRKHRVRARVSGSSTRPRLTVFISGQHVTAQIIDDSKHVTLAYATTVGNKSVSGTMTEKASTIGSDLAKKAKAVKITKVVFDRNGRLYHGRIKALAESARAGGLDF